MAGTRRLEELADRIRARAAALPAEGVVVALSGGADSACAAWLATDQVVPCRAVFVDHGLPASVAMRSAASAIAEHLRIELDIRAVAVPSGVSPENQARLVRYAALLDAIAEHEWLVTGHTSDDQAETVLLNILRGTGLDGLAGIPRRRDRVVRPMLDVTRSETRELAALLRLPWRDDPANEDPDPRRNQIRRALIPDLEARFNRRLKDSLVALAGSVAEAAPSAGGVQIREVEVGLAVAAPELYAVGSVAAAVVLREALRRLRGPHAGTRAEVDRLLEVANGRASATELTGGLRAFRDGPWLVLSNAAEPESPPPATWSLPGSLAFGSWALEAWLDHRAPDAFPVSAWRAVADADRVPAAVTVRAGRAGDEVDGVPVAETLRGLGIAPERRSTWPVVVAGGEVVWVPGARISRAVWVGPTTRRYLWVHAAREYL